MRVSLQRCQMTVRDITRSVGAARRRNAGHTWMFVGTVIHRAADTFLAFLISCFPICSTTKRIFLGCVKVRTKKL
jgi:hypothetical protein